MDIANFVARNREVVYGVIGLLVIVLLAMVVALYYQAKDVPPPAPQPIVIAPVEPEPVVEEEEPVVEMAEVLYAARNIPAGEFLDRTAMRWEAVPKSEVMGDHLVRSETGIAAYIGAAVREPVQADTPIFAGSAVRTNQAGYLAAVLKPNYRAITIPLTYNNSMAGFLNPGDAVNVTVTATRNGQSTAKTFLRNVRVIAIDQRVAGSITSADAPAQVKTVTLELKQTDVEKLTVARQGGEISFSLLPLAGWDKDLLESSADLDKVFRSPDAEVKVAVTLHRGESQVTEEFWVE